MLTPDPTRIQKRAHERFPGVIIEYSFRREGPFLYAFTRDLSESGTSALLTEETHEKQPVFLKIYLYPEKTALYVRGTVVWCRKSNYFNLKRSKRTHYDVGIRFAEHDEHRIRAIRRYIDRIEMETETLHIL